MVIVIFIGILTGLLEVLLLSKFIKELLNGKLLKSVLLLTAKVVVLAVNFIIVIMLDSEKIWISGLSVVVILIIGSAVLAFQKAKKR